MKVTKPDQVDIILDDRECYRLESIEQWLFFDRMRSHRGIVFADEKKTLERLITERRRAYLHERLPKRACDRMRELRNGQPLLIRLA